MERYQVVYSKRGFPLTVWTSSIEDARRLADDLRKAGYSTKVWVHTDAGSRLTDL